MKKTPFLLTLFMLAVTGIFSHVLADDRVVMTIDNKEITVDEFRYLYLKNRENGGEELSPRDYASMYALFKMKVYEAEAAGIDTTAEFLSELDYYCSSLESEDALLKNEYREGILLFEISNRIVWQRAGSDTEGLQTHFELNREKYAWEAPRAKGWLLYSDTEVTIHEANQYLSGLEDLPDDIRPLLTEKFGNSIMANKFIARQGINDIVDALVFKCGNDYKLHSSWQVVGTFGCRVLDSPETWHDVKSAVTSDYQQELTAQWEKSLLDSHKVIYNYDVIDEMAGV